MPLNTYIIELRESPFQATKNMLAILNKGVGVLKVFSIVLLNSSTIAGALCAGEIRRYVSANLTGYHPALDTGNPDLLTSTEIIFAQGGVPSGSYSVIGRYAWSSDLPAVGVGGIDEMEILKPWTFLWNIGREKSGVFSQQLTLRTNEMLLLWNMVGGLAYATILVELTKEGDGLPGGGGTLNELKVANEYPMGYVKKGKASELRSKVIPA